MYELYQAEWCPYSSRVRQELTERGVDVVLHQVAADPGERREMQARTGTNEIPVLVAGERVITEFREILAFLAQHHPRRPDAARHRAKARDPEEQHTRIELLSGPS